MDDMTIEEHKNMMIGEAIPLFENSGVGPEDTKFSFSVTKSDDGSAIIEMTGTVEGEVFLRKSRKVEQLNG